MITIIRHAKTKWNMPPKRIQGHTDVGISEEGREQARELGKKILYPTFIATSPALRCIQTIDALFPKLDVPVIKNPRLLELNMGKFTGLLETEAAELYMDDWNAWIKTPEQVHVGGNGGQLDELLNNGLAVLSEISASYNPSKDNILIVTHGGVIRTLRCFFEGKSLNEFHNMIVDNLSRFLYVPSPSLRSFTLISEQSE